MAWTRIMAQLEVQSTATRREENIDSETPKDQGTRRQGLAETEEPPPVVSLHLNQIYNGSVQLKISIDNRHGPKLKLKIQDAFQFCW